MEKGGDSSVGPTRSPKPPFQKIKNLIIGKLRIILFELVTFLMIKLKTSSKEVNMEIVIVKT